MEGPDQGEGGTGVAGRQRALPGKPTPQWSQTEPRERGGEERGGTEVEGPDQGGRGCGAAETSPGETHPLAEPNNAWRRREEGSTDREPHPQTRREAHNLLGEGRPNIEIREEGDDLHNHGKYHRGGSTDGVREEGRRKRKGGWRGRWEGGAPISARVSRTGKELLFLAIISRGGKETILELNLDKAHHLAPILLLPKEEGRRERKGDWREEQGGGAPSSTIL